MRKYYYSVGKDRVGPVSLSELKSLTGLTSGTLVWYEGLPSWVRADALPELNGIASVPLQSAETEKHGQKEILIVIGIVLIIIAAAAVSHFEKKDYVKKGDQYWESQDYRKAKEWYQKAIDNNPRDATACLGMGRAYLGLEEPDRAVKWYQKAIDINPNLSQESAKELYVMGLTYFIIDKYDQSITCFRQCIDFNPYNADAHYYIGSTCKKLKRYNQAITYYQRAIDIEPNYADAHFEMGLVYHELESYDRMLTSLRRAARLGHQDARKLLRNDW
jgi:tetratricopeptide (TPR) repeat protein